MTDDVNARLDSIFSARTAKEVEATQRANEARQKETNSLQAFLKLQEDLIRPALEALAQNLQDRGQVCNVFDITDGENLGGRRQEAAIGIRFLAGGSTSSRTGNDYPHLTIRVDKRQERVQFFYSTISPGRGGSASSDASIGYDDLTVDMINEKAIAIIAEVYR
ncbi:hypothetical protein [Pseudomonas brenneri]|uniref:hypothetical protein n=1 Tax=Pseudomonas brenneri TaxID=129817 RepID=UPI003BA3D286